MPFDERQVMSGTHGELWLDGELVTECYKCQAKVTLKKTDVPQCGVMWTGKKVESMAGAGSLGMYKINSRMARKIADEIRAGRDPRFTLISKLNDPDALGTERVAIKSVSFDDLTLADWEASVFGKIEAPFTFGDFEYIDRVATNE